MYHFIALTSIIMSNLKPPTKMTDIQKTTPKKASKKYPKNTSVALELSEFIGKEDLKIQIDRRVSLAVTEEERAQAWEESLLYFLEGGNQCNEGVTICQTAIDREMSWQYLGVDQATMRKRDRYFESVVPRMEAFRKTDIRCQNCIKDIHQTWGEEWRKAVDPEGKVLPYNSEDTLGSIRRISKMISAKELGEMLKEAIKERLNNWRRGRRTTAKGTLTDLHAIEVLLNNKLLGSVDSTTTSNIYYPLIHKRVNEGELMEEGSNDRSGKRLRIEGMDDEESVQEEEEEEVAIEKASFVTCGCKNKGGIKPKYLEAKKNGHKEIKLLIKTIEFLTPQVVSQLCWNHLRDFCSLLGLRTQIGGRKELIYRLNVVRQKRYELGKLKVDKEYKNWFNKSFRGIMSEDFIGVMRFFPAKEEELEYEPDRILERFGGRGIIEEWEEKGTIIVQKAMGWLFDDMEVKELIKEEVQMYLHHRRMVGGKGNLGWLRSAYFSQIQQISRQDPVYYALVAATSGHWWQISYPYYMKATLPGDGIQFQHIDLNLKRYMEVGRGSRRVQTSCSLTEENEENCTLVIPGFHKVIKEWWSAVLKREGEGTRQVSNHNSNCLKTDDIYTPEDKKRYGDFIPAICGPGDIRISRADILHGSAACKS